MKIKGKESSLLPTISGVVLVLSISAILFFHPSGFIPLIGYLENWFYDSTIKKHHLPLEKGTPVTIIDIDDNSLTEFGRWPWSRKTIATLTSKLQNLGAAVIAFDVLFSEKENNVAEEVLTFINEPSINAEEIKQNFDYDTQFASILKNGDSVLGLVFSKDPQLTPAGILPPPLLSLKPDESRGLDIPEMKSYLGNIEILEKAARNAGFINATPDEDGVIRYTPLILSYENKIYPSLALKAIQLYLLTNHISLKIEKYGNRQILEGVLLDDRLIPTDPLGKNLVPFRGPPYTFPFISAKDILNDQVDSSQVKDKIVFIGSSAAAMGDIVPTAISPSFIGVEIHASVAASILDNYLPYMPAWGKGGTILLTLTLGLFCALLIPQLELIFSTLVSILSASLLIPFNILLLKKQGILIPIFPPLLTVLTIYLFNVLYSYFTEGKKRKIIKSLFSLYLSPKYLDRLLENEKALSMDGETKELTVLFADIQNFTTISESLPAPEVKKLLNFTLTPLTQVIFDSNGTIDKYVGDMIMAFWGAPIDNPYHPLNAVQASLKMQGELDKTVNPTLSEEKKIHIRIGINTGFMNVGDMGSQFRRSYTVLGDSVNFASRLESICKYYNLYILVGEQTQKQTENDFIYLYIDRIKVKGKNEAVNIYHPLCEKGASELTAQYGEAHNCAMSKYFNKNWDEAEKMFLQLQTSHPEKSELYKLYLERIKSFKSTPPPSDWDGTHVFTQK